MGCWSSCVMGGDTPYDAAATITDILKLRDFDRMHMPDDWDEREQRRIRSAIDRRGIDKVRTKLLATLDNDERRQTFRIYAQVLGLVAISCGAAITPDARVAFVQACDTDEWAADDAERKQRMDELAAAIKSHVDGKVTTLQQEGLLEKLCSKFPDKKSDGGPNES